jgi:hypothetical protein
LLLFVCFWIEVSFFSSSSFGEGVDGCDRGLYHPDFVSCLVEHE